jgi:hypothetical protein
LAHSFFLQAHLIQFVTKFFGVVTQAPVGAQAAVRQLAFGLRRVLGDSMRRMSVIVFVTQASPLSLRLLLCHSGFSTSGLFWAEVA